MTARLSANERKILAVLQQGLPAGTTPFEDVARRAGIEPDTVLRVLRRWKKQGILRRIGAVVDHFKAGPRFGAMVVWRVQPQQIERVGTTLARFPQVSHAYQRRTQPTWPYNVYTMVHCYSAGQLQQIVEQMSRACGVTDYQVLTTIRELKKSPPKYITQ